MLNEVTPAPGLLTRRNLGIMLALMVLLSGFYWFTYSGWLIATDESALFDAIQGFVRRGTTGVSYTLHHRTLYDFPAGGRYPGTPWVDAEPMQILAAAPLFWFAGRVPGIGLVHTVWLFNILVCALSGAVFFLYARSLRYSERVSISGTLIYGLGTIVWPYSKAFFREPLVMLFLFSAATCLSVWRTQPKGLSRWLWLLASAVLYAMSLLTKEAALLSIPVFIVMVFPGISHRIDGKRVLRITLLSVLAVAVVAIAVVLTLQWLPTTRSYNPLERVAGVVSRADFIVYAFLGYLVSPGRSLFAFSPVLFLIFPGIWLLIRQGRWHEALVPVTATGAFVLGYSVVRNELWFGGLAWGPRYLVPVTPFAVLAVLPVLKATWRPNIRRFLRVAVVLVVAFSIWTQLTGVLIRQSAYFQELGLREVIPWQGGTWRISHSPLAVTPGLILREPLDFAWLRVDGAGYWQPGAAVLLVLAAAIGLWFVVRRQWRLSWRALGALAVIAVIGLAGAFYLGLRSIYRDPAFMGDQDKLHDLLATLDEHVHPDDIVVMTNPDYRNFVYNYYRSDALFYILRVAPGEQPSPEQLPEVVSTNPDMLVEPRYSIFLNYLAEFTGRIWIMNNSGPFTGYTVRPVEWYMVRHYFPVQTWQTDESARLILLDVNSDAPQDQAMTWPSSLTDARFGGVIELIGYDLSPARIRSGPYGGPDPFRASYQAGDVVPLSLLWKAIDTPPLDYNVGVFVIDGEGRVVVQRDSAPQGGFRPMDKWRPGEMVRDNHGLQLPAELRPGVYQIWVKVYAWQTQEPLTVEGANRIADGNGSAALLTTIEVVD